MSRKCVKHYFFQQTNYLENDIGNADGDETVTMQAKGALVICVFFFFLFF